MTNNAAKALEHETDFLSGVEANFEAAKGKQFRGSTWQSSRDDESDRLRALLASNRIFDREKLKSLPANRRIALHGFERRFLFGKRATGVAIASVLSPMGHYASDSPGEPGPIGLGELADHVRRLTTPRTFTRFGLAPSLERVPRITLPIEDKLLQPPIADRHLLIFLPKPPHQE